MTHRLPAQIDETARAATALSDRLSAETLVIGTPMYNFGVPAVLKACPAQ